jgi:hypothetical protein
MTVTAMPGIRPAPWQEALEKRRRNRREHYWSLIEAAIGRKKLRHAKDYFSALLADQPDDVIEKAITAVEDVLQSAANTR